MRAKKSLGQNFLISERIRDKIIEAGEIKKTDTVLEIGPGKGFLTESLLENSGKVIAVEKDDELAPKLKEKFNSDKLEVIHGDILEISEDKLPKKYKLIANIPYYITGEIIRSFLERKNQPELLVLMVQKEVADRIVARDKKESILSLSVKAYGDPKIVTRVSRGNFRPMPNVDSAVIKIENVSKDFFKNFSEEFFFKIIKKAFGQKRKRLVNNLKDILDQEKLEKALEDVGVGKDARAEDLSLKNWKETIERFQ